MYVNYEKRAIFLAHPRTASRAVGYFLRDHYGFLSCGSHHGGPDPATFEDFFLFTTVRNHWDAFTSWFFNGIGQSERGNFTVPWVRNWIKGHPNYLKPPFMWWFRQDFPHVHTMRYENLDKDFGQVCEILGMEWAPVPVVGPGIYRKGRRYQDVIPTNAAFYIFETFEPEIRQLGYTWDEETLVPWEIGE